MNSLVQRESYERSVLFDNLLDLKQKSLEVMVYEYTLWDEMVDFVGSGDRRWAAENIDVVLDTYGLSTATVYDPDYSLVYSANGLEGVPDDLGLTPFKLSTLFSKVTSLISFVNTAKATSKYVALPFIPRGTMPDLQSRKDISWPDAFGAAPYLADCRCS